MTARTLLVHATHLLARGFIAAADSEAESGALQAVSGAVRRALAFKEPDHAVAVLDAEPPPNMPPILEAQLAQLPRVLQAHGIACVEAGAAIDVVASYTRAALDAGSDVVIVGSDKRLAQLVGEQVWWYDAYKDVRYTPELVRKRFEVSPSLVSDWLALVGDDDTLPGVKGIGKKGATTLLESHGSIAAALKVVNDIPGRPGKALRAEREAAAQQSARAHLRQDLPLPTPLTDLPYQVVEAAQLNALYTDLGFFELLTADSGVSISVSVCATEQEAQRALASLRAPTAVEALTEDPTPARGALVGLAACSEEGRAFYFPLRGKGACLDVEVLRSWLEDDTQPKLGHDVKGVVLALARLGIAMTGVVFDTATASHLLEPSNWAPHDLPLVARQRLQIALEEAESVRGVGRRRKAWSEVKQSVAADFAAQRAAVTRLLWQSLEAETDLERLREYLELSEVLVRMEQTGIALDADDLAAAGDDFSTIEEELKEQIFEIVGKSFNLGSTKQLGSVLFEDLGLPILKRTKTGWSTANEALERIEHAHPVVPLVLRWRRLKRLRDSWVAALTRAISPDGRVHSMTDPARSFSGRLVNYEPDLGRVPGRTPEMQRIRHAFHAPEGSLLCSVDYSQLGLYVLAHLSRDPALVEPLRAEADMHVLTASAVLEVPEAEVTREQRQLGKVVNFATFAGQGASALALQLGLSAAEAKQLIARFDQRYAIVRQFQEQQLELAREQGYVVTLAGRRWTISGLTSLDQQTRAYAERMGRRATHEGSVADVSRRGLLRADQALRAAGLRAQPLLQVHDEVLFEVPAEELERAAQLAADAMRGAFQLEVPLRVGVKAGPNWAHLEAL